MNRIPKKISNKYKRNLVAVCLQRKKKKIFVRFWDKMYRAGNTFKMAVNHNSIFFSLSLKKMFHKNISYTNYLFNKAESNFPFSWNRGGYSNSEMLEREFRSCPIL